MFSVDNFYAYLQHKYSWPIKNNFVWAFETHGSRDLYKFYARHANNDEYRSKVFDMHLENYYGGLMMLDQEPIEFDQLHLDYSNHPNISQQRFEFHKDFQTKEIMKFRLSKVHTPIICHSEKNSSEVDYFRDYGFLDAHYWYHGLISRDWFRHWKHHTPLTSGDRRLGCYIRDTTGTREYRKDVLELIKQEDVYCPLLEGAGYDSNASAILEWNDTGLFDIQVVAETLFDTSKTHLTEKVLKPVAMEQPFILFAGPNSLQYMRDYGFQTFDCCWDESYDEITDSTKRYVAIAKLVKDLNALPKNKYDRVIERARLIAKNNREHFYSQKFEDVLLNELHTNVEAALAQQQERFFTHPGETYFKTTEILSKYTGDSHPKRWIEDSPFILKHIAKKHPQVAKQILKQYPSLF